MSTAPESPAAAREPKAVRWAIAALLWAAPIGIGLAAVTLIVALPFFRPGPNTPTAGDVRAWDSIWAALAFVGTGCSVGFVANAAWLAHSRRRSHRPSPGEWFRVVLHLLLGAALGWYWFG